MSTYGIATICNNVEIASGIWQMELYAPQIAAEAIPGQFINLYSDDNTLLLPRPMSLSAILSDRLQIIYRIVGKGTKQFSALHHGEQIKIIGPLGNGFMLPDVQKHSIVIGGGLGIPPLLELVHQLKGKTDVFLGFSQKPFLTESFERLGASVYVATQDGCNGYRGNVMELLENTASDGDIIFACGPRPMLRSVSEWAGRHSIPSQLSMEERMACGLGACLGCVGKVGRKGADDWEYLKVCKDGPVFWGAEVIWDE